MILLGPATIAALLPSVCPRRRREDDAAGEEEEALLVSCALPVPLLGLVIERD